MDLRRALVLRLALLFAGLIAAFSVLWVWDLRNDAIAEQVAASRLVDLVVAAESSRDEREIFDALQRGGLRHVKASLGKSDSTTSQDDEDPWLDRFGLDISTTKDHRIAIGGKVLRIQSDGESELREKLSGSIQVLSMLLFFAIISLAMIWYAVHRALSPVRELEAGLARLEAGEQHANLPHFELREFDSIAKVVDRLAQSLNRARDGQRRLTRQLLEVQDKDRRELAADLHDEFGQSLTGISASAAYIERQASIAAPTLIVECAKEIGNETRRISGHVRQMLANLRPYGIEDSSMSETLAEFVAGWHTRLPDKHIESRIDPLPPMSPACGLALYRTLQEALTNWVRHSGSEWVGITCAVDGSTARLSIADNGAGTAQKLLDQAGGGLLGLKERITMVGGQFSISDRSNGGIVLTALIPFSNEEKA